MAQIDDKTNESFSSLPSVTADTDLVLTIDQKGIGEMLKPMINEIHLFDSYVAGTSHLSDPEVLKTIKVGDKLIMKREDNKFDDKAIMILTEASVKIGYVPEKDNTVFARLMDAGKVLAGRITSIEVKGSFTKVAIGIYLIDF